MEHKQTEKQGLTMNVARVGRVGKFFLIKVVRHWKRCPRLLWYLLEILGSSAGLNHEQPDLSVKL